MLITDKEIRMRIIKANNMAGMVTHLIRSKHLLRNIKWRIYKIILKATLLYYCKTWVVNKKAKEKDNKMGRKNSENHPWR